MLVQYETLLNNWLCSHRFVQCSTAEKSCANRACGQQTAKIMTETEGHLVDCVVFLS